MFERFTFAACNGGSFTSCRWSCQSISPGKPLAIDRQPLKHGVANIASLAETNQKIIRDQMKTGVSLDNNRPMARECSKRFLPWWQASD
jgi:hypothetical protein